MANYKLLGPKDSEKEGWFKDGGRMGCDLGRIEMQVGENQRLMAEVSAEQDYPGIWLLCLATDGNGEQYENTVAILEMHPQEGLCLRLFLNGPDGEQTAAYKIPENFTAKEE